MKKILFTVLVILLVILAYYAVDKGITIGKIQILSISKIQEKNSTLDKKIEEANKTIDTEYPNKMSTLKSASNKLQQAKKEYLDLTNLSTNDQIIKATLEESYAIELLWAKVGNYARNKGVNMDMSVVSNNTGTKGLYDLNFTVNGTYLAIVNFIESIENDSILNLRIKDFKLVPSQGSILQATFKVKNIAIQGNTLNESRTNSTNNMNNVDQSTNNNTQKQD